MGAIIIAPFLISIMAIQLIPLSERNLKVQGDGISYDPNQLAYSTNHIINLPTNIHLCDFDRITLFKYYSFDSLKYVLQDHQLFINKVSSWDDKYENFFLKCKFVFGNNYVADDNFLDGVFGQSWTTSPETDALWRIYSQDCKGIRVRTTARKLFDALYIDNDSMSNLWFGKVKYDYMSSFIKQIEHQIHTSPFNNQPENAFGVILPETEFMKRREFEHEEEFRAILILDSERTKIAKNYDRLAFDINLNDFIEEYCLDPRLSNEECDFQKEKLIEMGVDSYKITRSTLYDFQPHTFVLN
ncbi:MAG: hypothetical protein PUC50_02175 [Bacteroidales bacterium]|nr:hypothetical protein [Bacteroidales bacterium]